VSALEAARALPPELQSSRIVVVSDFNCPYCFTLNEWLNQLGVAARVYWVGVEHKPHLPLDFAASNRPDDLETLHKEVSDVRRRAPEVGVQLPPVWVNSHQALLLQAAVEAEEPALAAPLRTAIFRRFWHSQANIARREDLASSQQQVGMDPAEERFLDLEQLERLTGWWRQELDRIPCMLAPSGARHLGLQDLAAVQAFVLGALHEPPPGPSCR
jgi:predicted DsbA family dithiol-disulfide isomerase